MRIRVSPSWSKIRRKPNGIDQLAQIVSAMRAYASEFQNLGPASTRDDIKRILNGVVTGPVEGETPSSVTFGSLLQSGGVYFINCLADLMPYFGFVDSDKVGDLEMKDISTIKDIRIS